MGVAQGQSFRSSRVGRQWSARWMTPPPLEPLEEPFSSRALRRRAPRRHRVRHGRRDRPLGGRGHTSPTSCSRAAKPASTPWPRREAGPVREAEERESAARVGVEVVEFAGWPDGAIEYGVPLRREIAAAVRRHRPDLVIGRLGRPVRPGHAQPGRPPRGGPGHARRRRGRRQPLAPPRPARRGSRRGTASTVYAVAGSRAHALRRRVGEHFEASVHSLEAHEAYNDALPDDSPSRGPCSR